MTNNRLVKCPASHGCNLCLAHILHGFNADEVCACVNCCLDLLKECSICFVKINIRKKHSCRTDRNSNIRIDCCLLGKPNSFIVNYFHLILKSILPEPDGICREGVCFYDV